MRYGVQMARRGWIEKKDVINTLPVEKCWRHCVQNEERFLTSRNRLPPLRVRGEKGKTRKSV